MASLAAKKSRTAAVSAPPADVSACDVKQIVRELASVADYVSHIRLEIGALRANELYRDRIPVAHDELGNVVRATASATNTIMAAGEEILNSREDDFEAYKMQVETKILEIFEACSFQDITGQRINKVLEALSQLEKRLARFAAAVNARDVEVAADPEDALRQARKEILLLNGPQKEGQGVSQDDIDALFD